MLKDLLLRNRSYRRFEQEVRISEEELTELVGLTCLVCFRPECTSLEICNCS